jgi:hypothetical protein
LENPKFLACFFRSTSKKLDFRGGQKNPLFFFSILGGVWRITFAKFPVWNIFS